MLKNITPPNHAAVAVAVFKNVAFYRQTFPSYDFLFREG